MPLEEHGCIAFIMQGLAPTPIYFLLRYGGGVSPVRRLEVWKGPTSHAEALGSEKKVSSARESFISCL